MNVIFWNDTTRPRYASINPDCGLTIAEIAERVVPAGLEWTEMPLDQAMGIVAPFNAIDLRADMKLSFAQLLIGLVSEGWITEAEGEAWLAGTLPGTVLLVIDGLPADQRFPAKARALRPSEVLRLDPMVIGMGTAAGKTDVEIDAFFTTYSAV